MEEKHKRNFLAAISIIILIIVFGMSIPLLVNIEDKMEKTASNNLVNATYIIENSVSAKLKSDKNTLSGFIDAGIELNQQNLRLFCGGSSFFQVNWIGRDGTGHSCEGEQVDLRNLGNGCFAMTQGEVAISRTYYAHSGRKAVAFGIPVIAGGGTSGALYAERYVEDYYSSSDFSFYEGAGRGYLVDAQTGEFVLKSLKSDGLSIVVGNLFENLSASGNDSRIIEQIKRTVAEGKTGTAKVNYDGKESLICFTPVEENKAWRMVTIIGKADLMAESIAVKKTIVFMLVLVTAGLVVALSIGFAIFTRSRKEAERKTRTVLLESIASTVEHAFIVYNPALSNVEYASENLNRLFGIESEKVRQDVNYLFEWLEIPSTDSGRAQFMSGAIKNHYEQEFQFMREGSARWAKTEITPSGDGKYVVVLTDITKNRESSETLRMAMKNAENANKAKSEFLSNMSHDIRTPMNGIIGMTAIAAANAGDEKRVRDCLKKISDASIHLLHLINEVLDMSKIESGKTSLNEEAFSLSDFMYQLIHMNAPAIEQKQQALSVNAAGVQHENVIADQLKLQQVMTNIISNANKYTPMGGKIEFTLTEKAGNIRGYGCYEFVCRDTGIGMNSSFIKKLFLPFERAHEPSMRHVQGTGLGMAIVKNIIDMMGGIIQVDSAPGKGSAFTVVVNLKIQDKADDENLPQLPVLVVDDEKEVCADTVRLLQEIGMAGTWVLSGAEAVKACAQARREACDYFAVILDWKMPEMDGIETTRQIRHELGNDIPIIILTAYDYEQIETKAREAGVTAFLPKPLFKSKLYQKLKQLTIGEDEPSGSLLKDIGGFDFSGKRILLVEDNALNMEIAANLLSFTGAKIDAAFHGKEALDKYLSVPEDYYDLILMDIQMPVMDGYETTQAIRSSGRSDALALPILAMTANAFLEDREKAKASGMNDYITKPIDIQTLASALKLWLEKGKMHAEKNRI